MAMDKFSSHTIGKVFRVKFSASCKSSNVIYLIMCRRCGLQYVGKTGQSLHMRINGHRYDITHRKTEESPVAEHFNRGVHKQSDMAVMVIELTLSLTHVYGRLGRADGSGPWETCPLREWISGLIACKICPQDLPNTFGFFCAPSIWFATSPYPEVIKHLDNVFKLCMKECNLWMCITIFYNVSFALEKDSKG